MEGTTTHAPERKHTLTNNHKKDSLLNCYNALIHEHSKLIAAQIEEFVKSIFFSQGLYHALFSSPGVDSSIKRETLQNDSRCEVILSMDLHMSKLLSHCMENSAALENLSFL